MFTDILQPTHLIFILVIALLVLGPTRLPGAGHALGQGLSEFRSSITGRHEADADLPAASPAAEQPGSTEAPR
jgi:sec-independent protein translocase protein TatA